MMQYSCWGHRRSRSGNNPQNSVFLNRQCEGILKTGLGLKAFRPTFVNELSDNDLLKRQDACAIFLEVFTTITKCGDVIFTDECAIFRSSRSRNVYFWSKENPNFYEELEHSPSSHVMVWAEYHADSNLFHNPLRVQMTILRVWLVPQLERMNLTGKFRSSRTDVFITQYQYEST
jgi:hypothetical protein